MKRRELAAKKGPRLIDGRDCHTRLHEFVKRLTHMFKRGSDAHPKIAKLIKLLN